MSKDSFSGGIFDRMEERVRYAEMMRSKREGDTEWDKQKKLREELLEELREVEHSMSEWRRRRGSLSGSSGGDAQQNDTQRQGVDREERTQRVHGSKSSRASQDESLDDKWLQNRPRSTRSMESHRNSHRHDDSRRSREGFKSSRASQDESLDDKWLQNRPRSTRSMDSYRGSHHPERLREESDRCVKIEIRVPLGQRQRVAESRRHDHYHGPLLRHGYSNGRLRSIRQSIRDHRGYTTPPSPMEANNLLNEHHHRHALPPLYEDYEVPRAHVGIFEVHGHAKSNVDHQNHPPTRYDSLSPWGYPNGEQMTRRIAGWYSAPPPYTVSEERQQPRKGGDQRKNEKTASRGKLYPWALGWFAGA